MDRTLRYAADDNIVLSRNEAHGFASRYALSVYVPRAIYTFIPKNGCSTMRVSLAMKNGIMKDAEKFNWIHSNNTTFSASLEQLVTAQYTFVILRCPFKRLASCYLDKIVSRSPPFWSLDRQMGRGKDPNDYTFRAFVDALANHEMLNADEHWRPQSGFLVYNKYDDVFDLGDFRRAADTLREKIGLEVYDARGLTRHGIDGLARVAGYGPDTRPLEILNLRAEGKIPEPESLYDDALIRTVSQLYASDLELFREHFPQSLMFDGTPAEAGAPEQPAG